MSTNTALAALALAYLAKTNAAATLGGPEKAQPYVEAQLDNVVRFFKDHPHREDFYSTSDLQVFYEEQHARNHCQSPLVDNKTILRIERSDVAELLAPVQAADEPGAVTDDGTTVVGAKEPKPKKNSKKAADAAPETPAAETPAADAPAEPQA